MSGRHNYSSLSEPTKWIFKAIAVASVITAVVLLAVSLKRLSSVEYGVEYDRLAKILDDAAKQGGLHTGPPGYRFIKFPSTQISAAVRDTCVSRDGLRVDLNVTFQYQMGAEHMVNAIEKYRDFKTWSWVVESAGQSAVQHTCSEFNITDFQTLRGQIQDAMFENLRLKLEGSLDGITDKGVYAIASSLQLEDIELPAAYKNAVADKQQAEEDIALAKNQRTQETTKARTERLAADEEARKILDTAENTKNITITEAQLKAQEILFAFEREKEVLGEAQQFFNLSPNGVLAYMSNQLYASVDSLHVTLGEPARVSRKDLLLSNEL
jgi:Membrane protease subunits, stomatin/prohibitin homologs